jgi:enamine deaminase RidA (YjgF/YER057c/UK114 family)
MKTFFWFLAVVFWISVSAQGLPAQQPACTADVEARLKNLGISLPAASAPVANYVPTVRTGNLVFLAGTPSRNLDGTLITGKVGAGLSSDQGYQAAWLTGIFLLSSLKAELGDLNKVTRIVKVFGMINADPTFTQHPTVINGISDLLVAVFGDCGRHARTAVGMGSLPFGIALEIDMVVEGGRRGDPLLWPPEIVGERAPGLLGTDHFESTRAAWRDHSPLRFRIRTRDAPGS